LKAEGLDDGESAEPQVAQVHAEWDDIGDDFPDLDSELVRDLAEDNLDYDEYVTKDTQAPQSRPAEKPGTNNQASGVGDAIEDALVANNMNRTESRSERPDALAADSTEFKAPMEAESMPTDLDWLASHEQTVEVIEITSDGAAPHGDLESKADMASTTEGRETERDQMRTGTDLSELDLAVLEDLREVMEDQFYSVLASYLKNAPMQLEILEDAAKAGDIDTMVRPAHSLKSSSANVGARRVSELAKEIESNARERLRTAAVAALPELREALDAASQQLAEIALGS
jgi:HPt (histidine-containing phosphotransfer) domain-containing protein